MSTRIPLLFLSPWPSFWEGGTGIGCSDEDEVHRALTRAGFDVHYLMPRRQGVEPPGPPSHFHLMPDTFRWGRDLPSALARPARYWSFVSVCSRAAADLAERIGARAVIGHSYYAARPAVAAARHVHVPSVLKLFGVMSLGNVDEPEWLHRLRNWEAIDALGVGADRVVILDDGTRGDRTAIRYGVSPEALRFWPNGLEKDFRTRIPQGPREKLRASAGVPPGEVVVVSVSRLAANKRLDLALEALARVKGPERWRWVVVGEGPLRADLEARARALGIDGRITWLGARDHGQVFEWLKAADIFLSTSELTNRSLSTLEAMMCALPVVATSSGSTGDVLHDGIEGRLVPMGADPIASALDELISGPGLRARMGRAGFEASASFPGWPERVQREVELYRELLERR